MLREKKKAIDSLAKLVFLFCFLVKMVAWYSMEDIAKFWIYLVWWEELSLHYLAVPAMMVFVYLAASQPTGQTLHACKAEF